MVGYCRGRPPSPSAGRGERHLRVSRGAAAGRRPAGRRRTAAEGRGRGPGGAARWGRRAGGCAPPPNPGMPGARFLGSRRRRGRPVGEGGPDSGTGNGRGRAPCGDRGGRRRTPRGGQCGTGTRWARGGNRCGADSVSLTAGRRRAVGGTDSLSCHDNVKTNTTESLSAPQLLARQRAAVGTESRGGERARWENLPRALRGASEARPLLGGSGKLSTSAQPRLLPLHLSPPEAR